MFVLVFSWTMVSTEAPKKSLLPMWSSWVWVLMIVVIGLSVTVLIRSRIGWPQPGSFVSTSSTPLSVTSTAVLPPLNSSILEMLEPVMTYKLSFTFSIVVAFSAAAVGRCGVAWRAETTIESVPKTTIAARTVVLRFMTFTRIRRLYTGDS